MNSAFWENKRVFITGHTGFKGGWLSLLLQRLGANVYGYSLSPPTNPSLYESAGVSSGLTAEYIADLSNSGRLKEAVQNSEPDIVIHLAAQPLVRQSYVDPVETYATNVMGTINTLEAIKTSHPVKAALFISTDKCYEASEQEQGLSETDALGGHDPYSSSKACLELAVSSWRRSFLEKAGVAVATARAGNVIGGGDWAGDRLVPDFFRSHFAGSSLRVRYPQAIRPWQHVLEPLNGYLLLLERLITDGAEFAEGWNFGPRDEDIKPVSWVIDKLSSSMIGTAWTAENSAQPHETGCLCLNSKKARTRLGWTPQWTLKRTLSETAEWYSAWQEKQDMRKFTLGQIDKFLAGVEDHD
jgi:CDP-glucose 4,6-dehydratase